LALPAVSGVRISTSSIATPVLIIGLPCGEGHEQGGAAREGHGRVLHDAMDEVPHLGEEALAVPFHEEVERQVA